MAALFCPRSSTAAFRSAPRLLSPITARAAFSQQTPRTWSAKEEKHTRSAGKIAQAARSIQTRNASTTTSPPPPSPSSTTPPPEDQLTWDRFFKLRRNRRWINAGCSIITAVATVGIGAPLLAQYDFDVWGAQISGLDPVIVLGVSTFGIAGLGWLIGPTIGNGGFRLWAGRKGWTKEIAIKEKSFYARIKKYRADPSKSSPQNPIPDYYGEKVASVRDYRRWLKDQRAFNLKKNKDMI